MVILNNTPDEVYDFVKQCGNQRFGLVTQCISYPALERNIDKLDMCKDVESSQAKRWKSLCFLDVQNLSQKINAKMGCINGVVNLKAALTRSPKEDLFMFFGVDVRNLGSSDKALQRLKFRSHTRHVQRNVHRLPQWSVHAIRPIRSMPRVSVNVGLLSRDRSAISILISEYPKAGRCSLEIIKELDTMVMELLKLFSQSCGNQLPNKIVFYRDGVDDGQYQKVLDNEVAKIKHAFRGEYE